MANAGTFRLGRDSREGCLRGTKTDCWYLRFVAFLPLRLSLWVCFHLTFKTSTAWKCRGFPESRTKKTKCKCKQVAGRLHTLSFDVTLKEWQRGAKSNRAAPSSSTREAVGGRLTSVLRCPVPRLGPWWPSSSAWRAPLSSAELLPNPGGSPSSTPSPASPPGESASGWRGPRTPRTPRAPGERRENRLYYIVLA